MTEKNLETYLIDKTTIGILDARVQEELTGSGNDDGENAIPLQSPTLIQLRDMMGWPAVDITKNELIIEEKIVKGHIPTRFYRKKALAGKKLPVLIFIHGGGFFGGSIDNVEQICRTFADRGDIAVVSAGYRLAPEHPYPAALLDCYTVVEYLATHGENEKIDTKNIFVSGDSAGGNLTLAVALLDSFHFKTHYVKRIAAYYPVTTCTTNGVGKYWDTAHIPVQSERERQLVHEYIAEFAAQDIQACAWYSGKADCSNPLISPLYATDDMLRSLPPVKIIIGEFDPLKLQTDALVERLENLEAAFEYTIYNGMIHAFIDKIGDYAQAEAGVVDALSFLLK